MGWKQNALSLILLIAAVGTSSRAAIPDLAGNWQAIIPDPALRTGTGDLPPLLKDAQATYETHLKQRAVGDSSFDTIERCLPPGTPRILSMNHPFEIVQRAGYVFMLFEYQHLSRQIFFADHHAPQNGRSFLGDSIARWEGDTLVIDTTGMKLDTLLDHAGLPHSKALHVVERYQLADQGRELRAVILIDDPKTYAHPWRTEVRFRRLASVAWHEDVCVDRSPNWFRDMMAANQL